MMNRGVLARQMFAQGGAAVPNEYKGFSKLPEAVQMKMDPVAAKKYDEGGEVATRQPGPEDYDDEGELYYDPAREALKKEIRDWIAGGKKGPVPKYDPNKQYFGEGEVTRTDSEAVGMAMGGDPAMAQGVGSMMESVDPAIMQDMLMRAGEGIQDLENVDNYEQMMNMIRGDEASIPERRTELAGLVGEQDAAQTPESVLALVQPVVQIASVDEGIGGLAQETMTEPVEGPMAEGIMSTMAPPPPDPAMMGGPPPANFKDGGLVRRGDNQPVKMMQAGGDPRLLQAFQGKLPVYEQVLGDPTAQLEEQKKLTQAQMLFDVANTALTFAAPMQGEQAGLSAAERLAMAAQQTQLLPTIGARAQKQQDRKTAAETAKQGLRASALTAAEAQLTAEDKAKTERDKLAIEQGYRVTNILLEQAGGMELAEAQANWKASLQDDQQLAAESLKKLEGVQTQEAIKLRKQLGNQNAIRLQLLKGEQALDELNIKSMNDIAKLDKSHLQALEIQKNNQALSREQKQIDVGLKTIDQQIAMDSNQLKEAAMLQQAAATANKQVLEQEKLALEKQNLQNTAQYRANQVAIAYADQEIKEAQMLQDADAAQQAQILNNKKLDLQEREVRIKEAAAGLDKFGKGLEGKLLGQLTDVEKLRLYETGDLGEQETTDLEASMLRYTDIGPVFDANLGRMVIKPARKLPDRVVRARKAREAAGFRVAPLGSGATGAATTATGATVANADGAATTATGATADATTALGTDITQQDVGAIPTGTALDDVSKTTYSSLLDEIDVQDAFGAPTALGNFLNRGVELITLGTAQAAPEAAKSTSIIESINKNATIIYMQSVAGKTSEELRKEIQATLPEPSALTKGEKSAYNKAKATIAFLNSKIDPIELELQGSPKGTDVGKRRNALAALKSVRDTYSQLADKLEVIVDPKPKPPRSDQEVADDLFG